MSQRPDDTDVSWYGAIVHSCIQEDKLSKLKATLKKFTKEQRQKIVGHKILGNASLFIACLQGKVQIANYFLDECGAEIEQRGIYEVEEDHSRHEVTPLWCAAVANKLDVVKALIQHGANVNSPSDTESTPVRSACYMTNFNVVKYLVDHGADIHKPNINGGTCLINSVQSTNLCQFLINKTADVNARDNSGNLALHYAIREGRLETVKLLIKNGSDIMAKNDFGDNALQTAALRGFSAITEYILENTTQSPDTAVHAYELLGANFIDEKHDIDACLDAWRKAMVMRHRDPQNLIYKDLKSERNSAYNNAVEPLTLSELEEQAADPELLYMQALLIRERILGPHHKDTTFGLMYRGAVYADNHQYQRCVDLWKYAFILRDQMGEPLNAECRFTIQALVKLFWEMQVELESGTTEEKVQFTDALEVFQILVNQIKCGADIQFVRPFTHIMSHAADDFQLLLQLSLHLMHLVSKLEADIEEHHKFRRLLHELVHLDPRGIDNESLLHLSVDPKISLTSEEFYSPFPSLAVVQVLIECNADVNAVDAKKNTPLYNSLKFLTYSELQEEHEEGILRCLLENDAHLDMCNCQGESALDLLVTQGLPICPLQYVNLRCIAARAVIKNNIRYIGEVPISLHPFIEMHG